jgi:hypothetical protein
MATEEGRVKPWRPGELVEGESAVQDILNAVAFVRQDVVFTQIGERLAVRNCKTVDDLAEYTSVEFCTLVRQFDIKHKARVYQASIEAAIQRKLDDGGDVDVVSTTLALTSRLPRLPRRSRCRLSHPSSAVSSLLTPSSARSQSALPVLVEPAARGHF